MIFVAVGTQLPFDRLIQAVDDWAGAQEIRIIAQTGEGAKYLAENLECHEYLTATEFAGICAEAELIVAHAGMGVILSAREYGKPLIIMPRRAELREHRNDHQLATAASFAEKEGIYIADNAVALHELLNNREILTGCRDIRGASKSLVKRICEFIDGDRDNE